MSDEQELCVMCHNQICEDCKYKIYKIMKDQASEILAPTKAALDYANQICHAMNEEMKIIKFAFQTFCEEVGEKFIKLEKQKMSIFKKLMIKIFKSKEK